MKTYDFSTCPNCCVGSLCSDCATLEPDSRLSSVEEMDRASQAEDSARMAKRKLMMRVALRTDSKNPDNGVFIEKTDAEVRAAGLGAGDMEEVLLSLLVDDMTLSHTLDMNGGSSLLHSAPFLAKVTAYLQSSGVPFEHMDVWVPSCAPGSEGDQTTTRLIYAGSATTENLVGEDGNTSRSLTSEETFNLIAFGDYSQRFSFDVGSGLPGRVYGSGRYTWEQNVHNVPHNRFERCGGAFQWGIKTAVAIPIASPNVGRLVVILYSCLDRPRDVNIVAKLSEAFMRVSNIYFPDRCRYSPACHSNVILLSSCSLFQLPNGSLLSISGTKLSLLSVVLLASQPPWQLKLSSNQERCMPRQPLCRWTAALLSTTHTMHNRMVDHHNSSMADHRLLHISSNSSSNNSRHNHHSNILVCVNCASKTHSCIWTMSRRNSRTVPMSTLSFWAS
jgi:hypothetical protein